MVQRGTVKDFFFTFVSMAYIGLGIASLVLTAQYPTVICGFKGAPPLRQWIFGTGIAYIIIGVILVAIWFLIWKVDKVHKLCIVLSYVIKLFCFAWMIVGAVSLWRDGPDCLTLNYDIWAMGMADVICTIVFVVTSPLWLPHPSDDKD